MLRLVLVLLTALLIPSLSFAADNGGFGASFTNQAPSALTESPDSKIAQTSVAPTDAKSLQDIMPAAGDDQSSNPAPTKPSMPPALKPDTKTLPKGEIQK